MENGLHEIIRTRMALRNFFFFDLLPANVNNTFRVEFDIYTPRPHFIILPKIKGIPSDFSGLTSQKSSLIKAAHSALREVKIRKGILSIHRGQWKSTKTEKFHAHICVDTEEYLKVLRNEIRKGSIPADNQLQSELYQNEIGKYADDRADFWKDVNATRKLTKSNNAEHVENIQAPSSLPKGVRLMCHPRKPLIGFFARINGRRIQDLLREVLEAMEEFAQTHGMTGHEDGCHLCLYLSQGTNISQLIS